MPQKSVWQKCNSLDGEYVPSGRFAGAFVVYRVCVTTTSIALFCSCVSAQVRAAEVTSGRPARAAQCFLEVSGVHYVGGDCLFIPLDKIGSFRIEAEGLSAQVKVSSASEGDASWSGPGGGAATIPLGDTYNDQRGCWNNCDPPKETHVCAWNEGQRLYLGPTPVAPHGSLAWGERAGMYAQIIASSGLDTEQVSITAEKSRDGAIILCRGAHDYSAECIKHTLEDDAAKPAHARMTLHANSKTKKYTDFLGRNLQDLGDDILDLDTNERLSTYAGGTAVASTAFEALCPKTSGW